MWESRVLCGISKGGGNRGKVGFGHFHDFPGPPFPQQECARPRGCWCSAIRPESQNDGQYQELVHRFPKSRVECILLQIVVQSHFFTSGSSSTCGSRRSTAPAKTR